MLHNALRRAGGLLDGIRRMVGGDLEVNIERMGETVTPILNPWGLPEWAALRGEALFSGWREKAGVAAENGYVGIVNTTPTGSGNNIIVVDGGLVRVAAATDVIVSLQLYSTLGVRETNNQQCPARDRRVANSGFSTARISVGGAAGALGTTATNLERIACSNAPNIVFSCTPVILRPGECLIVESALVNNNISACFFGRTRPFLPGELRA